MDCQDYITVKLERKKGESIGPEECGVIKALRKQGLGKEQLPERLAALRPPSQTNWSVGHRSGRATEGEEGQPTRPAERSAEASSFKAFIAWVVKQMREHKWSLDARCGYTNLHRLFARWSVPAPSTIWCSTAESIA